MDAAERTTIEELSRRLADVERERDALRAAQAQAERKAQRLAERYADLDARWRRSSVGSVVLFRAAQQIWTCFARWQDALARHRADREVDAAWTTFDRLMARLPATLAEDTARPDSEPGEAIEHLVAATRALLAAACPTDETPDDEQGTSSDPLLVDRASVEALRQALERYDKLGWLGHPHSS
jgi:hypothetical protein